MSDSPSENARAEEARKRQLDQKIQRQLDEALDASFPASDAVSIVTSHEEEDWGTDTDTAPPAKPAPGGGS
jgi:hypothetical protein